MKILHISDTHGRLPDLRGDFDVVVHSGDLLPNTTFGIPAVEQTFQRHWVEERLETFRRWLRGRPLLFCCGNHDYLDPTPLLKEAGIEAHSLTDAFVEFGGLGFYGFPWVPVFGNWNYMARTEERRLRLAPVVERLDLGEIDVLVTHGPMFGILDRNGNGTRCGSRTLRDAIDGARFPPRLLLHGHIHEAAGFARWKCRVDVSNAATTQRIVEIAA